MIKAVIDTNVIVSAYITKNLEAATSKLWEAVLQCKLTPIYNEEILSEYSEVLRRKKFGIPEHLVKWALDKIVSNGVRGERVLSDEFFPDPKDVVFYEVAMSKEDAYLVTGNTKHFPKKPIVVTPAEMLEILQREGIL
ncbi:putative toxin-antitoxin system toxin component, PIN family [Prevotella communis]|jgi:putative PIN family toxin of toxin-antitoxin system|uniref:putative toxin-antitoxin system toxin component, PIN family n=1 Tax=Prevotella communis TaxID=2913614 RepID=UPI001EDAED02|nr:putative toxin-antitoxin system toxin component, PIN family [Prevotella communis]UKK60908.1 putative toxin-antitoxin system toxin component, PIN family [Prevotella communis]UKK63734.1 putative toxin-antitoxin system toxin component, PIN family [Prevotella communis]